MQIALIVILLAACNQAYGLDATQLHDGAAPDAPYACTELAPRFTGKPVPIVVAGNYARYYSLSLDAGLAIAIRDATLYEGPIDHELEQGSNLMPPPPIPLSSARISPEGDELFVRYVAPSSNLDRYTRTNGMWVLAATVLTSLGPDAGFSAPTRKTAGPRRIVVASTTELQEYGESAPDTWTAMGAPYTSAETTTSTFDTPNLTPDGRHLVLQGLTMNESLLPYLSRSSLAERFHAAVDANPFFGKPRIYNPYLLGDCSRLYFFVIANPAGVYYVTPD